jgi:hypothetical protein
MAEVEQGIITTIKVKGRNGIFWLKRFKVVCGPTKTAIYFFSGRQGMQAPSAIHGDSADIVELLDKIKVEMVKQEMLKDNKATYNPSIGSKGR